LNRDPFRRTPRHHLMSMVRSGRLLPMARHSDAISDQGCVPTEAFRWQMDTRVAAKESTRTSTGFRDREFSGAQPYRSASPRIRQPTSGCLPYNPTH
jgi:hypothetical protein